MWGPFSSSSNSKKSSRGLRRGATTGCTHQGREPRCPKREEPSGAQTLSLGPPTRLPAFRRVRPHRCTPAHTQPSHPSTSSPLPAPARPQKARPARPLLAQAAGAGPGRPGRPGAKAQAGPGGALREGWSAARRAPRSGWHRLGPPLEMRTRWATPRCAAGLPVLLLLGCLRPADPSEHAGNRGLDAALGASAGCRSQVTSAFPTHILGVWNGMREPAGSCEESGVGPQIF